MKALLLRSAIVFTLTIGAAVRSVSANAAYDLQRFQNPYSPNWTYLAGINNNDDILGNYQSTDTGEATSGQGFLYSNNTFSKIQEAPGYHSYTYFNALNDNNTFAGRVGVNGGAAFIYDGKDYSYFSFPGAQFTEALGINNDNDVVGWYNGGGSRWISLRRGSFHNNKRPRGSHRRFRDRN